MKILVKGANWLGDAVMSLPTLRALREMRPKDHITMLTRASLASLYETVPAVDETVSYPIKGKSKLKGWLELVRGLKRSNYDVAIILPRSFSSALMAFTARIPRRIGYRGDGRTGMLTDAVDRDASALSVHRVHYYHRLLTKLGEPPKAKAPEMKISPGAEAWAKETLPKKRPLVVLNPGATYGEAKQWFPDRFVAVGKRLATKRGAAIVTIGGPAEADLGARVADGIGHGAISLSGKTDIPQLAAVLKQAALLLTNDTGPMHVADAVGIPIVAIFGPTDPVTTPPFRSGHAIIRKEIECSPCLQRVCPLKHHHCMKWIEADEVAAACEKALA